MKLGSASMGLRASATVLSTLVLLAGLGFGAAPASAPAASYYKPCGSFTYKGKHKLFKHKYKCRKAKRKVKYVLRHRHAPPGWRCSLTELRHGFAACQKGKRGWEFVPA